MFTVKIARESILEVCLQVEINLVKFQVLNFSRCERDYIYRILRRFLQFFTQFSLVDLSIL